MNTYSDRKWIVCQIGAREHYAIASELHARNMLIALCTDIWASPGSVWAVAARLLNLAGRADAGQRLSERFSPTLPRTRVYCGTLTEYIWPYLAARCSGPSRDRKWREIMIRNRNFARRMSKQLERSRCFSARNGVQPTVFAYSYAALEIFLAAKAVGCRTVLAQIDGGPAYAALLDEVGTRHGVRLNSDPSPPTSYWEHWRAECALADAIVVNSRWSAELMARAGIDRAIVHIAPLAYNHDDAGAPVRAYPERFSSIRPLRLLFLGHVSAAKGAIDLLQAMRRLEGEPVRLELVGSVQPDITERFRDVKQVAWIGPVPRGSVVTHYREADVFILPTHSDGFAITQLEAQACGLPVIASRFCGEVVIDGFNGRLIQDVTADLIEAIVRWVIDHPALLSEMSNRARERAAQFTSASAVDVIIASLDRRKARRR